MIPVYVNMLIIHLLTKMAEDSDEDMFTVPDVEGSASQSVHSEGTNPNSNLNQSNVNDPQLQTGKRRRGRNPADKEYRRLKRYMITYTLLN